MVVRIAWVLIYSTPPRRVTNNRPQTCHSPTKWLQSLMPRSGRRAGPRPFQPLPVVSVSEQLSNNNESLEGQLNFAPVGRGQPPKSRGKSVRRGKGRAVTQGVIIPIPNSMRDKSLAETRLKRARLNGDESQDETEEIIRYGLQTDPTIVGSKVKKVRGEYSCDQCYNRKTKV